MPSEQEFGGDGDAATDRESVRTDRNTDRELEKRLNTDEEMRIREEGRKKDRMLKRDCYGISRDSLCRLAWLKETQHFTNTTTMHGPKRIFNGRNWIIQLVWSVIFVFALCGLGAQIVFIVQGYIDNPPIGQIAFHLNNDGMTFPAVTLCNLNPIKKSEIEQLNANGDLTHDVLEYLLQTNMDPTFHFSNLERTKLEEVHEKAKIFMNNHPEFNISTFLKTAGHNCDETFSLCYFGGEQFNCCDYMEPVVTSIGKCYTLDLENRAPLWMQKQKSPGSDTGLQIIADANLQEEMNVDIPEEETMYFEIFEHGFRYFVHHPGAHPELSSEGVSVGPAKVAYTAIKKSTQKLLESGCASSYPPHLTTNLTYYSAPSCRYLCLAERFTQYCNCTPFTFNIDASRNICLTWESANCMDNYMRDNSSHLKFPECEECLFECESISYTTFNSYGNAFNKGSLQWLSNRLNKPKEHIQESVSIINIFFSEMFHTAYTQETTTNVHQMLSDIGGNMGMFAGMSVITIVEILLYFFKSTLLACCSSLKEGLNRKKIYDEDQEDYLEEETKKYQIRKNQHPLRSREPPIRNEEVEDEPVIVPSRVVEQNQNLGANDVDVVVEDEQNNRLPDPVGPVLPAAPPNNVNNEGNDPDDGHDQNQGGENNDGVVGGVANPIGNVSLRAPANVSILSSQSRRSRGLPSPKLPKTPQRKNSQNGNDNATTSKHSNTQSTASQQEIVKPGPSRAARSRTPGKRRGSRPLESHSEVSKSQVEHNTPRTRNGTPKKRAGRTKSNRG